MSKRRPRDDIGVAAVARWLSGIVHPDDVS